MSAAGRSVARSVFLARVVSRDFTAPPPRASLAGGSDASSGIRGGDMADSAAHGQHQDSEGHYTQHPVRILFRPNGAAPPPNSESYVVPGNSVSSGSGG